MRIPIALKLIALVITLVASAGYFIAQKNASLFESVLTVREEESNLSTVEARLNEVENLVGQMQDQTEEIGSAHSLAALEKSNHALALEIYTLKNSGYSLTQRIINSKKFKAYSFNTQDYFDHLAKQKPFPFLSVADRHIEMQNDSLPQGPAMIVMGVPISQNRDGRVLTLALGYFEMEWLQQIFSRKTERLLFVTDSRGNVLTHQDEKMAFAGSTLASNPLVKKAISESGFLPEQTQFIDPVNQYKMIGAYQRSPLGFIAYSLVSKDRILEPAEMATHEAFFITGVILSIFFFVAYLVSSSLTEPIEVLADLTERVAKGDLEAQPDAKLLRKKDEVGDLAVAFDHMTKGLREREKVKSLLNKFHGTKIAENLIQNEIQVGGQNKKISLIFTDIRGFTSFAEKHTPEEVVSLLNQYFDVMVKTITTNGGVIDKFIGDAIMAVWGVPHEGPADCHGAVTACLGMRIALEEFNKQLIARGEQPILIGMGVHTGRAISGTIGSEDRMEYTIIGDTVNLTSRIEGATSSFGQDLLVSEAVKNEVEKDFIFEWIGAAEVKGKSNSIPLYKVLGFKDTDGQQRVIKTPYSEYKVGENSKVKKLEG